MIHKFLRLTIIDQMGNKRIMLIGVMHIINVIENFKAEDRRPTASVYCHGGMIFETVETVQEIQNLLNQPDSLSGMIINPQENF